MRWHQLGIALVVSYATAGAGRVLTDLGPWYYALRQPDWKPPDVAFGIIWSLIFTLSAVSAAWAWSRTSTRAEKTRVLALYLCNAALNIAWSGLYFSLRRPDWAMMEWVLLWLSVLSLIVGTWRLSRPAALLNLPYLAWVTAAGALNWATIRLNGPFS